MEEGIVMFWKYYNGYTDYWAFFDTLANNFGLLYDSGMQTIQELTDTTTSPNYFMVGYSLGNIVYLIFFTA